MKFHIFRFLVIISFLYNCNPLYSQKREIKVQLDKNYFGWTYIVGTENTSLPQKKDSSYIPNKAGIVYVPQKALSKSRKIHVYLENKELNDSTAKFYFISTMQDSITIISFYVLNKEDLLKDESIWKFSAENEFYFKMVESGQKRLDSLVQNNLLKISKRQLTTE